jgi:hypothetical protein
VRIPIHSKSRTARSSPTPSASRRTSSTTARSAIIAFQDFDLRLNVLARYRSNGGVYVMTEFQPQGFPGKGFEIQVKNSHSDRIRTGGLKGQEVVRWTQPADWQSNYDMARSDPARSRFSHTIRIA